ncbi:hypothetical protein [Methanobrevibacter sp. V74]|uniref:hypothetical protein n=1 Tax=Methanobrevibacter sp. V74 TaxID=3064279 RepID=UPI0027347642|nr:hypothetical protein [Methanobrevibacter sp. V74]
MSSEKLLEVNENILSELTKLRKEVSEIKKGLNKSNPNKQKNNESYENLFDTELMKEILSEEKMYNIHKFMDLLENLKNGKPINNYSTEDNKISRKLYTEICELLINIKKGNYDSILTLDEKYISDEDSP